jgi:hypothetical protein
MIERYCERSEAISKRSRTVGDCHVAAAPRNDASSKTVIASEAKQSSETCRIHVWIATSLSLLAMTTLWQWHIHTAYVATQVSYQTNT